MIRTALVAFVVAASLACSSQQVEESSASGFVNANCPMMGKPIDTDVAGVDWNGKQVGFCCKGCIGKFEALSDDEKAAKLEEADSDM